MADDDQAWYDKCMEVVDNAFVNIRNPFGMHWIELRIPEMPLKYRIIEDIKKKYPNYIVETQEKHVTRVYCGLNVATMFAHDDIREIKTLQSGAKTTLFRFHPSLRPQLIKKLEEIYGADYKFHANDADFTGAIDVEKK